MSKIPELQVVIPYDTLVELLRASEELPKMRQHMIRTDQQLTALRMQFTELMDAFGEYTRDA